MRRALASCGLPENAINLVEDTARETATQMMKLNGYLDVLIPRGGAGLIQSVVMNAARKIASAERSLLFFFFLIVTIFPFLLIYRIIYIPINPASIYIKSMEYLTSFH